MSSILYSFPYFVVPFHQVLRHLLGVEDSLQESRIHVAMQKLVHVTHENLRFKNATLHTVRNMIVLAEHNALVRQWLFNSMSLWVESLLIAHTSELVRDETAKLLRVFIPGAKQDSPPLSPSTAAAIALMDDAGYAEIGPQLPPGRGFPSSSLSPRLFFVYSLYS